VKFERCCCDRLLFGFVVGSFDFVVTLIAFVVPFGLRQFWFALFPFVRWVVCCPFVGSRLLSTLRSTLVVVRCVVPVGPLFGFGSLFSSFAFRSRSVGPFRYVSLLRLRSPTGCSTVRSRSRGSYVCYLTWFRSRLLRCSSFTGPVRGSVVWTLLSVGSVRSALSCPFRRHYDVTVRRFVYGVRSFVRAFVRSVQVERLVRCWFGSLIVWFWLLYSGGSVAFPSFVRGCFVTFSVGWFGFAVDVRPFTFRYVHRYVWFGRSFRLRLRSFRSV